MHPDNSTPWMIRASSLATESVNPVSVLKDSWRCNPDLRSIDLSTDSPMKLPDQANRALIETILEGRCNGYAPSVGYEDTRKAILEYLKVPLTPKDIILSSGSSSCLDIAITALADRGQNILVPKPGNQLYKTLALGLGVEIREYSLLADTNEIDIPNLKNKIDANSAAIVINNPHNPTGCSYSVTHLWNILDLANREKLPLIVDEVYADLLYPDQMFNGIINVNVNHGKVPILVVGGLGKSFMVPGWRLGWILVHDPVDAFGDVRKALVSLSQRIIGCNTVIQGCLENFLQIPDDFRNSFMQKCAEDARFVYHTLDGQYGLDVCIPQATNFLMVKVNLRNYPNFINSGEFCARLVQEMSVICLPSEVFGSSGFLRITLGVNKDELQEAIERVSIFCRKHFEIAAPI